MLLWHLAMQHLYFPCFSSPHNLCEQGQIFDTIFLFCFGYLRKISTQVACRRQFILCYSGICRWQIILLDFWTFRLFMTAVFDILDFWIFRLFYYCIDAFFNLFKINILKKSNYIVIKKSKSPKKSPKV